MCWFFFLQGKQGGLVIKLGYGLMTIQVKVKRVDVSGPLDMGDYIPYTSGDQASTEYRGDFFFVAVLDRRRVYRGSLYNTSICASLECKPTNSREKGRLG